jgi:hypothetical protein
LPDVEAAPAGPVTATPRAEVFVRAIDLPTPSLRQARAAVAQQLDILSPLPPADVTFSLVLLGPAEDGLNRFAVGFASHERLWAGLEKGARAIVLSGWLDNHEIPFRFERASVGAAQAATWGSRLETLTIAGICLAILLAAANLRVDREIDRAQGKADAATSLIQTRTAEASGVQRVANAWRTASTVRPAGVVDCALGAVAKAAGGPVAISRLGYANGGVTVRLAAQPSDTVVTALRAAGLTPPPRAAPPASDPAAPAAPAPPALDFQTSAAECR